MKIKKRIILGGLTVVMATAITAGSVYAAPNDFANKKSNRHTSIQQQDKSDLLVRHQVMETAFVNNDYNEWKELMKNSEGRVVRVINETNFPQFAEAHRLIKSGKFEEAKKILTDLGVMKKMTNKEWKKELKRDNNGKHLGLLKNKIKKMARINNR